MNVRILTGLLVLASLATSARADGPGDSVVKVYATQRGPDLFRPWNKANPSESSGSGVVIEGNRILTSAHVVLYASEIFVQGKQGGDKVEARLAAIQPGIDLALLTVDNKDFFATRPAIRRAQQLPQERDAVEVFGYPFGGNAQSVTKGVVSRIEYVPYTNSTLGVRVQIDAALNPGNSGGPAMVGTEMIGIAFSRFTFGLASNIGYVVPNEEIETFLKDPAPRPGLPLAPQNLQNESLRKKLGIDDKTQGIVIGKAHASLQRLDILTHVGEYALDNFGNVKIGENLNFHFQYAVAKLAKNDKVPVTIVRNGETLKLDAPVVCADDLVIPELKGEYPAYFLYGPLVFTAATSQAAAQFTRLPNFDISSPLFRRQNERVKFPGEQLVVVSSPMFKHKCVRGYNDPVGRVVEGINGVKIKNLRHFVEVLSECKDDFVTFNFAGERAELLVLERKDMADATREVMDDNGIARRGSAELVKLWEARSSAQERTGLPIRDVDAGKLRRRALFRCPQTAAVHVAIDPATVASIRSRHLNAFRHICLTARRM